MRWKTFGSTKNKVGALGATALLLAALAAACGGGEKATPTRAAPQPTATAVARPTAQPTATTAPAQPTPTRTAAQPTATPVPATPTRAAPAALRDLRVAIPTFTQETNDPAQQGGAAAISQIAQVYDWWFWHDAEGNLAPGIVTKWQMGPEAKSWNLEIRDMNFHDGSKVLPQDLKFSLERMTKPGLTATNARIWQVNLASIDVLSPNSLRVTLKSSLPDLPLLLTPRTGGEGAVVSKALVEKVGESAFFASPVGSGAWKFASRDQGVRILFEANTAKHPFRPTPAFKTLELRQVPEESTRLAALRTGQLDIAAMAFESLPSLAAANLHDIEIPNITNVILGFFGSAVPDAFARLPLANVKVRQALSVAVNRQEIVNTLLRGRAKLPARSFVIPGVEGFDPSWRPEPFNPDQARQLLTEAGYARGGVSVKFWSAPHPTATWMPLAAEAIAGYWSSIGVRVDMSPTDYGTVAAIYRRTPQVEMVGSALLLPAVIPPTPLTNFGAFYSSTGALKLLNSKEIDDLLTKLGAAIDPAERQQLIREVINLGHSQYVGMPLATAPALFAATSSIEGWQAIPSTGLGMALETVKPKS